MTEHSKSGTRLKVTVLIAIVVLSAACFLTWRFRHRIWQEPDNQPEYFSEITIQVAGQPLDVELADTDWKRAKGLMFRKGMPPDHGMLFAFPEPMRPACWMKNTYLALSVAYITEDGTITQIERLKPLDETRHPANELVRYALEMRDGWFERHDVNVGDRVEIPDLQHVQ